MNLLMLVLNYWYKYRDFLPKLIFRLELILGRSAVFSNSKKSDSDSTNYTNYVESILQNNKKFAKFRKKYSYRIILEHVDYNLGKEYFQKLRDETINSYLENKNFYKLSTVGSPRKFYFRNIGWISPTILRYLYVDQNIRDFFGHLDIKNVGEIGVGFGGQFMISSEIKSVESYAIYDLPVVQELTNKFVNQVGISRTILRSECINPVENVKHDLILSNYAYSELPRTVQLDYAAKVLTNSKCGYLTMNSGRSNFSGRSTGKMSLEEILEFLPNAQIIEEDPKTGPDNYLLVWGHR